MWALLLFYFLKATQIDWQHCSNSILLSSCKLQRIFLGFLRHDRSSHERNRDVVKLRSIYPFILYIKISFTLFENYSKCRIWILEFWHFPPIFVLLILTHLVTLFGRKLHFWYFWLIFVDSKCKRSLLRSQCWMRLFLWFSNTVLLWPMNVTIVTYKSNFVHNLV